MFQILTNQLLVIIFEYSTAICLLNTQYNSVDSLYPYRTRHSYFILQRREQTFKIPIIYTKMHINRLGRINYYRTLKISNSHPRVTLAPQRACRVHTFI